MKTVQKLEVFFGIFTLLAAIMLFYREGLSTLTDTNININRGELLMRMGLFLFLPAILTAMGAYIHAVKQFTFGLVFLFIGGGFLVASTGLLFLVAFYASDMTTVIIRLLPGFLAATTIVFAIRTRMSGVISN